MENTPELISVPVLDSATQERLLAEGHLSLGYFGSLSGNVRLFRPKDAPPVSIPPTNALYPIFSKHEAEMFARRDSTLLGTTRLPDGKFAWILMVGKLRKDPAEAAEIVGQATPSARVAPAAQPRLTVRLTSFPESNGKRNWTALLVREEPWNGLVGNCGGVSLARGEFWNRVAYEAERARFLIGERDTEPFILDYGDDIETPDQWLGEKGR